MADGRESGWGVRSDLPAHAGLTSVAALAAYARASAEKLDMCHWTPEGQAFRLSARVLGHTTIVEIAQEVAMWSFGRAIGRRGLGLAVSGGRVGCPRRGDIDMEQCLVCPLLDDVDDSARPRVVYCVWPAARTAILDMLDSRWHGVP